MVAILLEAVLDIKTFNKISNSILDKPNVEK